MLERLKKLFSMAKKKGDSFVPGVGNMISPFWRTVGNVTTLGVAGVVFFFLFPVLGVVAIPIGIVSAATLSIVKNVITNSIIKRNIKKSSDEITQKLKESGREAERQIKELEKEKKLLEKKMADLNGRLTGPKTKAKLTRQRINIKTAKGVVVNPSEHILAPGSVKSAHASTPKVPKTSKAPQKASNSEVVSQKSVWGRVRENIGKLISGAVDHSSKSGSTASTKAVSAKQPKVSAPPKPPRLPQRKVEKEVVDNQKGRQSAVDSRVAASLPESGEVATERPAASPTSESDDGPPPLGPIPEKFKIPPKPTRPAPRPEVVPQDVQQPVVTAVVNTHDSGTMEDPGAKLDELLREYDATRIDQLLGEIDAGDAQKTKPENGENGDLFQMARLLPEEVLRAYDNSPSGGVPAPAPEASTVMTASATTAAPTSASTSAPAGASQEKKQQDDERLAASIRELEEVAAASMNAEQRGATMQPIGSQKPQGQQPQVLSADAATEIAKLDEVYDENRQKTKRESRRSVVDRVPGASEPSTTTPPIIPSESTDGLPTDLDDLLRILSAVAEDTSDRVGGSQSERKKDQSVQSTEQIEPLQPQPHVDGTAAAAASSRPESSRYVRSEFSLITRPICLEDYCFNAYVPYCEAKQKIKTSLQQRQTDGSPGEVESSAFKISKRVDSRGFVTVNFEIIEKETSETKDDDETRESEKTKKPKEQKKIDCVIRINDIIDKEMAQINIECNNDGTDSEYRINAEILRTVLFCKQLEAILNGREEKDIIKIQEGSSILERMINELSGIKTLNENQKRLILDSLEQFKESAIFLCGNCIDKSKMQSAILNFLRFFEKLNAGLKKKLLEKCEEKPQHGSQGLGESDVPAASVAASDLAQSPSDSGVPTPPASSIPESEYFVTARSAYIRANDDLIRELEGNTREEERELLEELKKPEPSLDENIQRANRILENIMNEELRIMKEANKKEGDPGYGAYKRDRLFVRAKVQKYDDYIFNTSAFVIISACNDAQKMFKTSRELKLEEIERKLKGSYFRNLPKEQKELIIAALRCLKQFITTSFTQSPNQMWNPKLLRPLDNLILIAAGEPPCVVSPRSEAVLPESTATLPLGMSRHEEYESLFDVSQSFFNATDSSLYVADDAVPVSPIKPIIIPIDQLFTDTYDEYEKRKLAYIEMIKKYNAGGKYNGVLEAFEEFRIRLLNEQKSFVKGNIVEEEYKKISVLLNACDCGKDGDRDEDINVSSSYFYTYISLRCMVICKELYEFSSQKSPNELEKLLHRLKKMLKYFRDEDCNIILSFKQKQALIGTLRYVNLSLETIRDCIELIKELPCEKTAKPPTAPSVVEPPRMLRAFHLRGALLFHDPEPCPEPHAQKVHPMGREQTEYRLDAHVKPQQRHDSVSPILIEQAASSQQKSSSQRPR